MYDGEGAFLVGLSPNPEAKGEAAKAAKTYLEQLLNEFESCTRDELIKHALKALNGCKSRESDSLEAIAVGVVGMDEPFKIIEGAELQAYSE